MNAAADAACRRARSAELRLEDELLPALSSCEELRAGDQREIRLLKLQLMKDPTLPARNPLWLHVSLTGSAVLLSTMSGYTFGKPGLESLTVGLGVAGLGALVVEFVLLALDHRKTPGRTPGG